MNSFTKNKLTYWLQLVGVWTFAFLLLHFLRHFGLTDINGETLSSGIEFRFAFRINLFLGFVCGTFYFLIELLMERKTFRRLPFGQWVGLKAIFHILLISFLYVSIVIIFSIHTGTGVDWIEVKNAIGSKVLVVLAVYFTLVSTLLSIIQQLGQKMGRGTLRNMLMGKYHHPREEERIFLFIDLQSSTTIAEQLGNVRYSRLIKDCFVDLTDTVLEHDAEIYQYVGDEVILCWKAKAGIRDNNCIEAFFTFQKSLLEHTNHYRKEYNLQPTFKAGAHIGITTITEVGVLKREIAYHGDVLNTAARLESKCNELEEQLLISANLLNALSDLPDYQTQIIGSSILRGKKQAIKIVSVQEQAMQETKNAL